MTDSIFQLTKTANSFQGGANASVGSGQTITVQVIGTFEAGDGFNLNLSESNYGYRSKPMPPITALLTFGKKMYATSDELLNFSEINQARNWDTEFGIGAGFISMLNEFSGAERLTGMAAYSSRMAIFGRRGIQVWSLDVDPSRNSQTQVLSNVGALAPRSITQVGDVDVFFLSDSGVRSLRSRDINNIAFSADIGNPIDDLVTAEIRTLGAAAEDCLGLIDPTDGRYWLIAGQKIYVFSHFTGAGVSAWSTYEPGFEIVDAVSYQGRLYLRDADDQLYLYGGADNNTYDDCPVEGIVPFLSAGTPATMKTYNSFDAVVEGQWSFYIGTNPEQPDARDLIGTLWAPSFDMKRIDMDGTGTHFSVRFTCNEPGYARLSNLIVHYTPHEAG